MKNIPGLKQFRQEGCISHLFYDPVTGETAVIDPRADLMEDYRSFIAENHLKPVIVIDTRLHWHHLSGSHLMATLYRIPVGMSGRTESARLTRRLPHGEKIRLGQFELQVLETPGVSSDAICLAGSGLVFTGDTLLVGTGARTDIPGAIPAALFKSLHSVLSGLPDEIVVFTGYDMEERLFSTIGTEKKRNPDWAHLTEPAFVAAKREESQRGDSEARRRMEYNASIEPAATSESHFGNPAPSSAGDEQRVASINVEKYALKMKEHAEGTCFLDVREVDEFKAGHMPGAINIPLSELALHLGELSGFKRVYISCQSGRRSGLAAKTLDYLKLPDVVNVSGGIKAWTNAGFTVT